ncbi:hypothetical protein IAI10_02615 [Clostridium sp. 19966]|uniref:hypothetical protein n=1 Tax=Clostridium sp. 19966 TaxID=2768166 RepID=UPI0028E02B4A|nr:hypothetical protein [Clostridium sp. 19966]MDT8715552.1 hypothetical protein [Clostridium sp. 19966]
MNKIVKELITKTIDAKMFDVQDLNFSDMTEAEKSSYEKAINETRRLYKKLSGMLTKEQLEVLAEYSDARTNEATEEIIYNFRRGFYSGLEESNHTPEIIKFELEYTWEMQNLKLKLENQRLKAMLHKIIETLQEAKESIVEENV